MQYEGEVSVMKEVTTWLTFIALGLFVVTGAGCATGGGGGGGAPPANTTNGNDNAPADNTNANVADGNVNDNTPPAQQPALIKTSISLGTLSGTLHRIEAGDDLWSNPLFTLYPEIGPSHMKRPD